DAVIGSSPRRRETTGVTVATGSEVNRITSRPIVAFQKPMTNQGSVTAKSRTRRRSRRPKPPLDRAVTASQRNAARVAATKRKNRAARQTPEVLAGAQVPTTLLSSCSDME